MRLRSLVLPARSASMERGSTCAKTAAAKAFAFMAKTSAFAKNAAVKTFAAMARTRTFAKSAAASGFAAMVKPRKVARLAASNASMETTNTLANRVEKRDAPTVSSMAAAISAASTAALRATLVCISQIQRH